MRNRRAAVDRQELFQAASALAQEGKPVTALALLEALGGGSLRTIYRYLNEWEAEQPAVTVPAISKIPESVQSAVLSMWNVAIAEAGGQLAAEKQQAADEVSQAHKELEEVLDENQKLLDRQDQDALQIEQLQAQVLSQNEALNEQSRDNAAQKATTAELRQQVASQQAELERLYKDGQAQRQLQQERYDQLAADYEKSQAKAAFQIAELQEQVTRLQTKTEQVENDRALIVIRLEQATERITAAEQGKAQSNKERDEAIQKSAELKGQVEILRAQVNELVGKIGERPLLQAPTPSAQLNVPAAETREDKLAEGQTAQSVKLLLRVTAKSPMNCPIGQTMQARENIEKTVLSRFNAQQISNRQQGPWESVGEYQLVFSVVDQATLETQLQNLNRDCDQEARKLKCAAACEITGR